MESLLANYASSDDEEQDSPVSKSCVEQTQSSSSHFSSLFSSLPQPKSSSSSLSSSSSSSSSLFQNLPQPKQTPKLHNPFLGIEEQQSSIPSTTLSPFSSLPQPKQTSTSPSDLTTNTVIHDDEEEEDSKPSSKFSSSTSRFSSLPQPKSQIEQQPKLNLSSVGPKTKRVVQLRPLLNPNPIKSAELDDDDDEEEEQERKIPKGSDFSDEAPSVKSFLSSLPAARNTVTLGVQASSGSGRRAIIETDMSATNSGNSGAENNVVVDQIQNTGNHVSYDGYASYQPGADEDVQGYAVNY